MAAVTLEDELKKNPQLKLSDIQSLREWCNKQPHLPKIEDSVFALFLHRNYYRIESAKDMIENYYTIRTHVPEMFSNRDPFKDELRQMFTVATSFVLEGMTKDGYKIVYATLLDGDSSRFDFNNFSKFCITACDVYLRANGTCCGFVIIFDCEKVSFGHITRTNPLTIKKLLCYVQEALPIHLKGIHFINATAVMDLFMKIAKPFMKKELVDMLHLHTTIRGIFEYIPVELLPNDIGGKAGSVCQLAENTVKILETYREWIFADEQTGRVNESLRIGKSKSTSDLFGVEGSFKKLEID